MSHWDIEDDDVPYFKFYDEDGNEFVPDALKAYIKSKKQELSSKVENLTVKEVPDA